MSALMLFCLSVDVFIGVVFFYILMFVLVLFYLSVNVCIGVVLFNCYGFIDIDLSVC